MHSRPRHRREFVSCSCRPGGELHPYEQIRSLFSQVAMTQGDAKRETFEQLVRLLAVHETAEEEVVHPTARRKLDSARCAALADAVRDWRQKNA